MMITIDTWKRAPNPLTTIGGNMRTQGKLMNSSEVGVPTTLLVIFDL